jgi:hypothetical protein
VDKADPGQVAHRAGHGGRADLQHLGEVRCREPLGVADQESDEDAGGHGREAGRYQDRREPLNVLKQRIALVTVGFHHVSKSTGFLANS